VIEILLKETNLYAEIQLLKPPFSLHETRYWVPTTSAEIRVFLKINLHFGLYPLTVRDDYWKIHKLGQFIGIKRFQQIRRFFSLKSTISSPLNAP
jgi:Transposase IS4